jgi:hypothetical protein
LRYDRDVFIARKVVDKNELTLEYRGGASEGREYKLFDKNINYSDDGFSLYLNKPLDGNEANSTPFFSFQVWLHRCYTDKQKEWLLRENPPFSYVLNDPNRVALPLLKEANQIYGEPMNFYEVQDDQAMMDILRKVSKDLSNIYEKNQERNLRIFNNGIRKFHELAGEIMADDHYATLSPENKELISNVYQSLNAKPQIENETSITK